MEIVEEWHKDERINPSVDEEMSACLLGQESDAVMLAF